MTSIPHATRFLVRWRLVSLVSLLLPLLAACSLDPTPSLGRHTLAPEAAPIMGPDPAGPDFDASMTTADAGGLTPQVDAAGNAVTDAMSAPPDAAVAIRPQDAAVAMADDDASESRDATVVAADATVVNPQCMVGNYAGDFSCVIDPTGVTPLPAMTRATFSLEAAASGATLTIQNTDLSFSIAASFVFAGDLSGGLDCTTGKFHGDIINGIFTPVLVPVPVPFTGSVDGVLDSTGRTITGTWFFTAPTGDNCTGPWTASLQP